ncbi:MAG: hypothetical protein WC180_03105 [Candidatus Paceibacterota bacterium]
MVDILEDCKTNNTEAEALLKKATELNLKGEFKQAALIGKAVAFDALRNRDFDLLRQTYFLLASLEDDEYQMYAYIQGAYEASKFNGKIYITTCYRIIIWMQHLHTPEVLKFIEYILSATHGDFTRFLVALYAKLINKPFDTATLPIQLENELKKFKVEETKAFT